MNAALNALVRPRLAPRVRSPLCGRSISRPLVLLPSLGYSNAFSLPEIERADQFIRDGGDKNICGFVLIVRYLSESHTPP